MPSRKVSAPSGESRQKFTFLSCDGPDGQLSRETRRKAKRHAMQRSKLASSSASNSDMCDLNGATLNTPSVHGTPSLDLALRAKRGRVSQVHHHGSTVSSQIPMLMHDDISYIGHWFMADTMLRSAKDPERANYSTWAHPLFDAAQSNQLLFNCMTLLTLHKRKMICNEMDKALYLHHKQEAYRGVRSSIEKLACKGSIDAVTAASIALLSYAEVFDGQIAVSQAHQKALVPVLRLADLDEIGWRMIVFNDLRLAAKTGEAPSLPYGISSILLAKQRPNPVLDTYCRRLALKLSKLFPSLGSAVNASLFDALCGVHRATQFDEDPLAPDDVTKLIATYDAEYRVHELRAASSDLLKDIQDIDPGLRIIADLLCPALHLHLLVVSKNWAPGTAACRHFILSRGLMGLKVLLPYLNEMSFSNSPLQRGAREETHADVLIWILFVFIACSIPSEPAMEKVFIDVLGSLLSRTGRRFSFVVLETLLTKWPWSSSWYSEKLSIVWPKLEQKLGVRGRWQRSDWSVNVRQDVHNTPTRFVGVLPFYDM